MTLSSVRDYLESRQVAMYFAAVVVAVVASLMVPSLAALDATINAALAVMLFATFLNVPLGELGKALTKFRFVAALLFANFVAIPLLVAVLVQVLPPDPLLRFGVLLVLLTPCIDYVVTFAHLGRADSRSLLAATPLLLALQILLLPVYLGLLLADAGHDLIAVEPFVHAFVWLIVVPLALAGLVQAAAKRNLQASNVAESLGLLAVPATALVLFIVVCAVIPRLDAARDSALKAAPVYIAFALLSPLVGLVIGYCFRLPADGLRAVAFSAATRNSLVVLPLALAVPGAVPVLPAVIVTQTLIELVSELVYLRLLPKVGARRANGC